MFAEPLLFRDLKVGELFTFSCRGRVYVKVSPRKYCQVKLTKNGLKIEYATKAPPETATPKQKVSNMILP
jgi:hypothetical protein